MSPFQIYLGLGSNLGNRLENLQWAVQRCAGLGDDALIKRSAVYESAAHVLEDNETQPAYLNAVIGLQTTMPPLKLLAFINELEAERGRDRANEARWASRTLDIDILAYGDIAFKASSLQIPHRRLADRKFVLIPWADIAPDFEVPAPFSETVAELLATCKDEAAIHKTGYTLLGKSSA